MLRWYVIPLIQKLMKTVKTMILTHGDGLIVQSDEFKYLGHVAVSRIFLFLFQNIPSVCYFGAFACVV